MLYLLHGLFSICTDMTFNHHSYVRIGGRVVSVVAEYDFITLYFVKLRTARGTSRPTTSPLNTPQTL